MHWRIIIVLILASFTTVAQHNHYIYIQSDNAQLFYIRKGSEVLSSSSSGFVILPKIQPGQQEILIGFPKNEFPEYQFSVEVKGKDRGFALKNFNEKGWGLFDLQSLEVIMGKKVEPKKEEEKTQTGPLTSDPFSVILASAVDDQRIRETSLVYREEITAQNTAPTKAETITKTTSVPKTEAPVVTTVSPKKEPVPIQEDLAKKEPVTVQEDLAKKETAVPAKTDPPKQEPAQVAAVVPSGKVDSPSAANPPRKDSLARSVERELQTDPARPVPSASAKQEVAGKEPGVKKNNGLFSKNPFAKKKKEPVTTGAGVVMVAGASGEVKKDNEALATAPANNADSVAVKESAPSSRSSYVIKFSEYKSGDERVMIYIDHQPAHDDTIRLSIPEEPAAVPENEKLPVKDTLKIAADTPVSLSAAPAEIVPMVKTEPDVKKQAEPKPPVDKPAVAMKQETAAVTDSSAGKKETASAVEKNAETRTDCRRMATEKDMVAMRKKMIMMADEDEMIALALKDFKARCYSAERIQNLSYVFTTDKGRYKLFDAAFPYVYDPSNFEQLERLLNDDYYIKRFRALVNKN